MVIFSSSFSWAKKIKETKTSADADQTENDIMTAQEINKRNHPWLSRYIKICYETKRVLDSKGMSLWRNKFYWSSSKYKSVSTRNNVLLVLIDNQFARNGC